MIAIKLNRMVLYNVVFVFTMRKLTVEINLKKSQILTSQMKYDLQVYLFCLVKIIVKMHTIFIYITCQRINITLLNISEIII